MAKGEDWAARLREHDPADWPAFLAEHSGLPGPRANLALASSVAECADDQTIAALTASGDEYHAMCAAAAAGFRAHDARTVERARRYAADERWRVREGVALGLQLQADADVDAVVSITRAWVDDPDPLVARAAVATICEPRLLRTPETAAAALDICSRATQNLVALPTEERRSVAAHTLRQALGYGWSVAVAAAPGKGVPLFRALDSADPDVAWIVRENRRKKRLASLLL